MLQVSLELQSWEICPLRVQKKHLPYLRNNYLLSSTDFTIVQSWWACLPLQYAQKSFIFANRALAVFSLSFFFLSLSLRVYWLLSDLLIVQCSSLSSSSSLQCRRFLWARNLLAKAPCWNSPKRGGNGASQRERGGGGEREEKAPARKKARNTP